LREDSVLIMDGAVKLYRRERSHQHFHGSTSLF
jgi:hypothetical protein